MVALAAPSSGQNLLTNPDLDTDLSGWDTFGEENGGTVRWSPFDSERDPASGSMFALNRWPIMSRCTGMSQYVEGLEEGGVYRFGGNGYIPSEGGPFPFDGIQIELQFRSGDCNGPAITPTSHVYLFDVYDQWVTLLDDVEAPPNTGCGLLLVSACKELAVGEFSAYLDSLVLSGPELFADGFESGDTTAWDMTAD